MNVGEGGADVWVSVFRSRLVPGSAETIFAHSGDMTLNQRVSTGPNAAYAANHGVFAKLVVSCAALADPLLRDTPIHINVWDFAVIEDDAARTAAPVLIGSVATTLSAFVARARGSGNNLMAVMHEENVGMIDDRTGAMYEHSGVLALSIADDDYPIVEERS
jgi:hypothetical protein